MILQTPEQRISDLIKGSNRQLEEKRYWRSVAERNASDLREMLGIISMLRLREIALEERVAELEDKLQKGAWLP